jgi:hypothetical protein
MSRYALGKLFFDVNRDRTFALAQRFQADPEGVLAEYDLSEAERAAVRSGDVRAVYEAGVSPLLVRMGARALFGPMSSEDYRAALAGASQVED